MINRRDLLKIGALASASAIIPFNSLFSKTKPFSNPIKTIKPPRLKIGDTIGLAVPGSSINEEELKDSIINMEKLGFKVFHTDRILKKTGFLGGTDQERAADLNELFANKKIKAIICARGGYGCNRLAELIDYNIVKANPKIICGYSDITTLLYQLYSQTGLVCFHGPVATSTFNEFSVNNFMNTLVEPKDTFTMKSADEDKDKPDYKRLVINPGTAEGVLAGGNLSLVVGQIGTKYDVCLDNKILFIEEVGEEPYRIDRMLTQLLQADKLKNVAGIAMGVFSGCEEKKHDPEYKDAFTLREVLKERLGNLKVPIIYGLSFGHITNKFTLPFGIKARLDTDNESITLLEKAVE
ncbi:MAG: LD-carboxypeptidase [bacterium]